MESDYQNNARKYHCSVSKRTCQYIMKKYLETGKVTDKVRSGRPQITSIREKRVIRRIALCNRRLTANQIKAKYLNYGFRPLLNAQ